jgi:hypothetical protein
LARRLEQLQADAAGRTTNHAAKEIDEQLEAADANDASASDHQAAAAQEDLEKAQKQLAQRRRQAEADLAREQMARLQQSLHGWHERQSQILAETENFDREKPAGRPAPNPAAARALAQDEHALENETRQQAGKLTSAEVFGLALAHAARDMARAAESLDRGETSQVTQQAEQDAVAALARLLEALTPPKPKPDGDEAGGGEGQGSGQPQGKKSAASLAELKLLKLMQEDLNARYQRLRQSDHTPQSAAQMTELAVEQGRMAELTLKLSEPSETDSDETSEGDDEPAEPTEPAPGENLRGPNKDTI